MNDGVTIGQAAAFASVTVKAIRHYHQRKLIDEPPRDSSGYRRYDSADLLRLVQIRTLAAAGVPLADVGAILDADPDQFAAALVDVERRLTDRINDLIEQRGTLRRIATGDRALLPDRALALLDRAPDLGFTPGDVAMAREGMVLIKAVVPEGFDDYVYRIERALDDPQYITLIKLMWSAAEWEPNDPRVDELAASIADHFLAHPALLPIPTALQAHTDSALRYSLLTHHGHDQKPAWARLTALIEARLTSAGSDSTDEPTDWTAGPPNFHHRLSWTPVEPGTAPSGRSTPSSPPRSRRAA